MSRYWPLKEKRQRAHKYASETQERQSAASRSRAAASLLSTGKRFQISGNEESAHKWFRKVVYEYPESEAATEAKTLLGEDGTIPSPSARRTWTDKSGQFRIEAEYIDFNGTQVTLKKSDGSTITVPLDRLSEADQKIVQTISQTIEK